MSLHVFVFLLIVCLLLSLTLLWCLDWFRFRPSSSKGVAKRTTLHCLLKPRSLDDCPACCLASPPSSGGGPAPASVRPWRELKSRRGASKHIDTAGFACPNRLCPYFGITEAHIHALVGDGKHGKAERIQTFRGPAIDAAHGYVANIQQGRTDPDLSRSCLSHDVQCSTRHSIVSFENPLAADRSGADLALAEGLDTSEASRVSATVRPRS